MPLKLGATGITFHDNSVQTTAGGPVTTLYAIGSYTIGRPNDYNNYTVNSTVAGSSFYATSFSLTFGINENGQYANLPSQINPGVTHVNVGSWRCVSPSHASTSVPAQVYNGQGLWVRYA
jgi:hypothetical protein